MFFIGKDKNGLDTLFVQGKQNPKEILMRALNHGCEHVYLGFNGSFNPETENPVNDWNFIFEELIKAKIWLSCEIAEKYALHVTNWDWSNYEKFVPVLEKRQHKVKRVN